MGLSEEDNIKYPEYHAVAMHLFTENGIIVDKIPWVKFSHQNPKLDPSQKDIRFRWFHLPGNNMEWAEVSEP
jgi:hypothetical protein